MILFARNIKDPVQLSELIAEIRGILADRRGADGRPGRRARGAAKPPHWPALPPAGALRDDAEAYAHGRALGAMVKAAGFDVTAAPVLDLRYPGASDVVGTAPLPAARKVCPILGGKIAEGILAEGVIPVMKHLPGHGRALVDSHFALPRVTQVDLTDDFLPFIANNNLPWAMTAHVIYEQYDPVYPATVSPTIISKLFAAKSALPVAGERRSGHASAERVARRAGAGGAGGGVRYRAVLPWRFRRECRGAGGVG